jgi:hypothetical protein
MLQQSFFEMFTFTIVSIQAAAKWVERDTNNKWSYQHADKTIYM